MNKVYVAIICKESINHILTSVFDNLETLREFHGPRFNIPTNTETFLTEPSDKVVLCQERKYLTGQHLEISLKKVMG